MIPENSWNQKENDLNEFKIDTFLMGNDWEGNFDYLKEVKDIELVYLPRTPEISTTKIKKDLNKI